MPSSSSIALSSISKFPVELISGVQVIAITEYIHEILSGDSGELPVDMIRTLLQTNSKWRSIAAKIVSDILGIDRNEDGSLQTSPWYPLRVLSDWASRARRDTVFTRSIPHSIVPGAIPFLSKSPILRAYFGLLSLTAFLRFNTLDRLSIEFYSKEGNSRRQSYAQMALDLPSSDLSAKIAPLLCCRLQVFLAASVTAYAAIRLNTIMNFVKGLMILSFEFNLPRNPNYLNITGDFSHLFEQHMIDIQRFTQADHTLPLPGRLVQMFRPLMDELQHRMDELTDEQMGASDFRSIWRRLPRIVNSNSPHCLRL